MTKTARRPYRKQPYEVRLQSAIRRLNANLIHSGECLLWTGKLEKKGYGRFRGPDGKKIYVHRFAYILKHGSFPDGLVTDHTCRNRACCNPDHLEPVTNVENIRRGEVGITNRSKTTCSRGHSYTPDNTYICSKGKRHCIICRRINGKKNDATRLAKKKGEK